MLNKYSKYTIEPAVIGEGASAVVYEGYIERLFSKKIVAIKHFDLLNPLSKHSFMVESVAYHIIKKLGFKYFAKIYRVDEREGHARIVMKLYDYDLFDFAMRYGEFENLIRPIFKSIFKGVKKLHDHGIAHLDLKPENILMKGNKPFISDFGAIYVKSKNEPALVPTLTFQGTCLYAGPELQNEYFEPFMADIFSLGVMMHTCLTRAFPYRAGSKLMDLTYAHHILTNEAFDLLAQLLSSNPFSRPTIGEVLEHPWFKD